MTDVHADPTAIGPFIVLRKLGEGAMGVVYAGFDVGLDRKVALKLVRRQLLDKPAVRARMMREAQAMARLSSPYVVQVYQVGEHAGGIYVAMEYIDGQTLGEWLHAARRPWHVVLRTVCDAGRGLAAAHEAGLVHRDFKPDNVLVDGLGRARVLDFGLVQTEGGPGSEDELAATSNGVDDAPLHTTLQGPDPIERSNLHWSVRLTQAGKVIGTPAYMSPEQHFGQVASVFSDQFSFSVTLYEALYGTRPFAGDSWASIKAQVERGLIPPPPVDSPVPLRVFKVLQRGLATAPERRWPSLGALLEALERDPRRARLRAAAVAGMIALASAGSYAAAMSTTPTEQRCSAGEQALMGAWGPEWRAAVEQAFMATRAPFAGDAWRRVESRLDTFADAWVSEHTAACEAHAVGAQTTHLMDLRVACLARRRSHLATLVDVFAAADRNVVENAVQAAAGLPAVQSCGDMDRLVAEVPPPDDPQTASKVEALRERLARVAALESTGSYAQGQVLAAAVRAEAGPLGYAPLLAEAALREGSVHTAAGQPREAEAALVHALRLALAHDLPALAAEAAAKRIFVVGEGLGQPAQALAAQPYAEALVERVADDGRLAALLHNNLGTVFVRLGDRESARAQFAAAIELLSRRGGAPDPLIAVVHHNLANVDFEYRDLAAARRDGTRALELFTSLLGERHPMVAHPLAGLGDVDLEQGAAPAATQRYAEALALMEAAYGAQHPYLVHPLTGLGRAHARLGRTDEARQFFARAVAIAERTGLVHPLVGQALEGLGELTAAAGEREQGLRLLERAVEVYRASDGPETVKQRAAALRAGELAEALGDAAGAIAWYDRVLALKRAAPAPDAVLLTATLALAHALDRQGGAQGRVCALLTAARAAMAVSDERRAATESGLASACAPSPAR